MEKLPLVMLPRRGVRLPRVLVQVCNGVTLPQVWLALALMVALLAAFSSVGAEPLLFFKKGVKKGFKKGFILGKLFSVPSVIPYPVPVKPPTPVIVYRSIGYH